MEEITEHYDVIRAYLETSSQERYAAAKRAASSRMRKMIRMGQSDDLTFHHSKFNDFFFLAVTFEMSWERQRRTAWWSMSNALAGYWEWNTHSGYDMHMLLIQLGIKGVPDSPKTGGLYQDLSDEIVEQIVVHFKLPTNYFSKTTCNEWSKRDRSLRGWVENFYQRMISINHSGASLIIDEPRRFVPRKRLFAI